MPFDYKVQQGDCLASIAKQFGFADWKTIYNNGLNDDFRDLRPDPNVIYSGDILKIPDKEKKTVGRNTGQAHIFQVTQTPTLIKILVHDIDGAPCPGKPYKLTIEGDIDEGNIPDDGVITRAIRPRALDGELQVWLEDAYPDYSDFWTLKLGHLDPIDTLSGVQGRLNNLGYCCGKVDGIDGPNTQTGVKAFQEDRGLTVDGIAGPDTQAALQNVYGF